MSFWGRRFAAGRGRRSPSSQNWRGCSQSQLSSLWAPRRASTLALLAMLATGCSGINASKSISPLDFILPGLMQNCPPAPVVPLLTNSAPLLAQAGHVPFQQP